ncbi:MAG: HesB/IscA family protein [Candidatus Hodarchaeales archaeon]|jgi:Fe-S cluster assembly iron-binding protein IscA
MELSLLENEKKMQKEDKIALEKNGITLYDSAYRKISQILETTPKILRISLEPSGCAGVSYTAKLDTSKEEDIIIEFGKGVKILVSDLKRFPADKNPDHFFSDWDFLKGLHLKYSEDLMTSKFEMDNPNAIRGCSCGISFKPKGYGGKPKKCK